MRTDSVSSRAAAWSAKEPDPVAGTPPSGRLVVTGRGQQTDKLDEGEPTEISLRIPGAPDMEVYVGAFEAEAPAAADPFGLGCGVAPAGPLDLSMRERTLPVLGRTCRMRLRNAPGNGAAINVYGFSREQFGAFMLPLDLGLIGGTGCFQRVSLDVDQPLLVDPAGTADFELGIPDDPLFLGNFLYLQVVVLNPAANRLGAETSNGLALRIGG